MDIKPYKNRHLDLNSPVLLYRCLNRKGKVYSIKQNNKVVGHTESFILKDCTFIINESGRQRAIKEKVRNVHAFIKGYLGDRNDIFLSYSFLLKYNPFDLNGFTIKSREIKKAKCVYTTDKILLVQP